MDRARRRHPGPRPVAQIAAHQRARVPTDGEEGACPAVVDEALCGVAARDWTSCASRGSSAGRTRRPSRWIRPAPGCTSAGIARSPGRHNCEKPWAAALVQLSFWNPERPLLDPFCGTGTIVIEAAMLGRRLAPGRKREFAAEHWPAIDGSAWQCAREESDDLALAALSERPMGTDRDAESLKLARYHAEQAGVADDIHFQQREFGD